MRIRVYGLGESDERSEDTNEALKSSVLWSSVSRTRVEAWLCLLRQRLVCCSVVALPKLNCISHLSSFLRL